MKKRVFYTELAYAVGLAILALGTALTVYGNFGISMVVAPAYILHLKLSEIWPFFSFGVAEYAVQALILALMMLLLRKARWTYLLSFVSAVLYGTILDGGGKLTALLPADSMALRIIFYLLGVAMCVAGIALLFRSYFPPAAYELFVMELAAAKGWSLTGCKTVYDWCSLAIAAVMSLCFFGDIRGIGWGTLLCAALYGVLIRMFSTLFDRFWIFTDRCEKVRKLYE
jgi:uncharacterized membrane protein YczE